MPCDASRVNVNEPLHFASHHRMMTTSLNEEPPRGIYTMFVLDSLVRLLPVVIVIGLWSLVNEWHWRDGLSYIIQSSSPAMTFLSVIFALIYSHLSNEIRVKSSTQLYASILHFGYFLVCYRQENGFACQKKSFLLQLSSMSLFWIGFWFLSVMCFPSFICVFVNYAFTQNVVDAIDASNHAFKSVLADLARSKKIASHQQNVPNKGGCACEQKVLK